MQSIFTMESVQKISCSYYCAIAVFALISPFLAITSAQGVVSQYATTTFAECSAHDYQQELSRDSVYVAPGRFVPAPRVDARVQDLFFKLFQRDPEAHSHSNGSTPQRQPLPPGLGQSDLDYISEVCPRDAFFYSLSPQHLLARQVLQTYFSSQQSAADVLRVAKIVLYNHDVNPKVWYYALMATVISRSDMSGLIVAQPLDALPDLFIPRPVLEDALRQYRVPRGRGGGNFQTGGVGNFQGGSGGNFQGRSGGNFQDGNVGNFQGGNVGNFQGGNGGNFQGGGFEGFQPGEFNDIFNFLGSASSHDSSSVRLRPDETLLKSLQNTTKTAAPRQGKKRGGKRTGGRRRNGSGENQKLRKRKPTPQGETHAPTVTTYTPAPTTVSNKRGELRRRKVSLASTGPVTVKRVRYGENVDSVEQSGESDRKHVDSVSSNDTSRFGQRIQRKPKRVKRQDDGFTTFLYTDNIGDCVLVNGTVGAENGIENSLWYFREDIMLNQHHWFWHQQYPLNATRHGDRRAELFFFFHRNVVARYNAERLSNGLPRTTELPLQHGANLEDGYDSHLIDMNSGKSWTPRIANTPLTDVLHEQDPDFQLNVYIQNLTDIYYRLVYSIRDGNLVTPNQQLFPIRNRNGIEHLSNTVEASELSVNPLFYDATGIHNLGHMVIGLASDPQFISQVPTGVMADVGVTMRDPAFYAFHSTIDNLFDKYKRTLPPYQLYDGEWPLVWEGVQITSLEMVPHLSDGHVNGVRTFWTTQRFGLEPGVDGSIHDGDVNVDICALHLNHEPFTFRLTVAVNPCVESDTSQGTVRIFMAPRYDESGRRFPLRVQRRLMFQLDVFQVDLRQGRNILMRSSQDSSLTKPWSKGLRDLYPYNQQGNNGQAEYCGCGWPRHLFIPKGSPQGMEYDLFAMITSYDNDAVQNSHEDLRIPEGCNSPYLLCGVPWRRYPDARPMGYPFDRTPYRVPTVGGHFRSPESLDDYVNSAPNMASSVVVVQHVDTIV